MFNFALNVAMNLATLLWFHVALWALAIICALAVVVALASTVAVVVRLLRLPCDPIRGLSAPQDRDEPYATPATPATPAPARQRLPPPGTPVDRPPVCPSPLTPHTPVPFALPAETFGVLSRDDLEALADVAIRLREGGAWQDGDPVEATTSPRWQDANRIYLDQDWRWMGAHAQRPYWRDALADDSLPFFPFYAPPTEPHLRPTRWGYQGPIGRDPQDAWADSLLPGYDVHWLDRVDWTGWDDDQFDRSPG